MEFQAFVIYLFHPPLTAVLNLLFTVLFQVMYRAPEIHPNGFSIRDVQLLANFTAATSNEILGDRDIWVHEGLQLAIQVLFPNITQPSSLIILAEQFSHACYVDS